MKRRDFLKSLELGVVALFVKPPEYAGKIETLPEKIEGFQLSNNSKNSNITIDYSKYSSGSIVGR